MFAFLRIKHSDLKYFCGSCHKGLSSKQKLEDHMAKKHGTLVNIEIDLNEVSLSENEEETNTSSHIDDFQINETSSSLTDSFSIDSIELTQENFDLLGLDLLD